MAAPSTLVLAPVGPAVYAAVRDAHRPPRRLWIYLLRLLLQYTVTVPAVVLAVPFVVLRNAVPFLRKHPAWTFKTGVSTTLVRIAIYCMGIIRFAPAPHSETGWLQGDSVLSSILALVFQLLTFRSYGARIWADTKTVPHVRHLGRRRLDEVLVTPPPADWLRGILAIRDPRIPLDEQVSFSPLYYGRPMIEPGFAKRRVKCYWYLSRGTKVPPPHDTTDKRPAKPVLLWCHGGAGVSFSAGDNFMGATLAATLARNADVDVLTVDYDLAPYAKYPTTLLQLFSAWLYLVVDVGYDPSQIFIGGDSYGGFSTLLFNRYLRDVWPLLDPPSAESVSLAHPAQSPQWVAERVDKLTALLGGGTVRRPPPTPGLVLFSPWLHILDDGTIFRSRATAMKHDIVTMQYMHWGTDALEVTHKHIKSNSLPATSPWLSPFYISAEELAALPAVWLGNGGAESLLDEGTEFVRRARLAGTDVEHHVRPGMPHDFWSIPFEINNAKKDYALLKPWIQTHYEAGQRRAAEGTSQSLPASSLAQSHESELLDASQEKRLLEAAWTEAVSPDVPRDVESKPLNNSLTASDIVVEPPTPPGPRGITTSDDAGIGTAT